MESYGIFVDPNEDDDALVGAHSNELEDASEDLDALEDSFNVPEKFVNKSKEDIIRSYQELEKTLGTQGRELGELRKLADQVLQRELDSGTRKKGNEVEELTVTVDDLADNPKEVISKVVHSELKTVNERIEALARERAISDLARKHPDYLELVSSAEFLDWVKASPYRVRQYTSANTKFDLEAADELFSTFKEISKTAAADEAERENKRKEDLKKATMESSSSGKTSNKIYRRADLIRMRQQDPDRFEAMQPEIMAAYKEGRVK